jgi:hypothetical protein
LSSGNALPKGRKQSGSGIWIMTFDLLPGNHQQEMDLESFPSHPTVRMKMSISSVNYTN